MNDIEILTAVQVFAETILEFNDARLGVIHFRMDTQKKGAREGDLVLRFSYGLFSQKNTYASGTVKVESGKIVVWRRPVTQLAHIGCRRNAYAMTSFAASDPGLIWPAIRKAADRVVEELSDVN